MFRTRFVTAVIAAILPSASAFAGTYAVGSCLPKLPSYTTISQAVSAVPAASTIQVCPGNYPEQVVISKPLTLQGVESGNSGAAVVTVPSGGLTQSIQTSAFSGAVFYQILVQNTSGPVDISNLAVDGTGEASQTDNVAGIFYLDSTGTVNNASARNQPGDFGSGILALTTLSGAQTVTIQNSVVRGLQSSSSFGIVGYAAAGSLTTNITGNTVRCSTYVGCGLGIEVYRATGTIQSNIVSGTLYGLLLFNSNVTAAQNTISSSLAGVSLYTASGSVTGNQIDAGGQIGVSLVGYMTTNPVVQGNTISNSSTAILGCDTVSEGVASGYTITGNTIRDAAVGIQMPAPNNNIITPNTYYATATVMARPCD